MNSIWNRNNSRLLKQAFSVDSSLSHFPLCVNLIFVARAHRVPHTLVMTHCIHPPLFLQGTAPKERPLPAARTEVKGNACADGLQSQPRCAQMRGPRNCVSNPISAMICLLTHRQVANSPPSSRGSGRAPKVSKGMPWAFGVCIRVQVGILCSYDLYQPSTLQKDLPKNLSINWTANSQSKILVFHYWVCCIAAWHTAASVLQFSPENCITIFLFILFAYGIFKMQFSGIKAVVRIPNIVVVFFC